ncbi:MAG: Ig-like domain-containing protein [Algoriphagus aquaeductus]|uniref:Ig-like domain-containing protein n=1 Tax=Algoriphagus aquaeductus TaxID=475299 RepID=UPI0038796FBA
MRTFKTNLLGLALAGLILGACSQTATYETADLMNEQASAKNGGFNLSPFGMGGENLAISDAPCIDATSGAAFASSVSGSASALGTVSVSYYNTLTHMVYVFSGLESGDCVKLNNSGGTTITSSIVNGTYSVPLGSWKHGDAFNTIFWVGTNCQTNGTGNTTLLTANYSLVGICTETTLSAGTEAEICEGESFTLTASVAADGNFTGGTIEILNASDGVVATAPVTAENKSVTYSGPWTTAGSYSFSARYVPSNTNGYKASVGGPSVVEVKKCVVGCDAESFTYVATNKNLDVVFSYNYKEAASVTLTFTLPQAKIEQATGTTYYGDDGKAYLVGGNGTNLTWTGSVSCSKESPTTFAFKFAADCGPSTANDGKANIWTSTEVKAINGVTLVDDPNTPENEGPYSLKRDLNNIVFSGCPTK